jgi:YHS domain-containing protein
MKKLILPFTLAVVLLGCNSKDPVVYSTDNGAIDGYDPVAFFTDSAAVKGDKQFSTEWNGATWSFSSPQNRDLFTANPEKFAPQYGGYCAYGTADGHLSPTQADTWTILDGRLFFNYNQKVKEKWMEDTKGYIEKADRNWPDLSK